MTHAAVRRPLLPLAAAIFFGLVVALGAAGFDLYFKTDLLEVGDVAVNALQVDNAKHFSELYGNYSRFEFNHPGPAFFYVYAAGEGLFYDLLHVVPSPGNAQLLASMCLQCAFFAAALAVFLSWLPWRALPPLALLAAALYFGSLPDAFISIWPPHVLLMPFLCFLVAGVSVAAGEARHLPLLVVAGGFLFHGHVAQPLFVGALGALAVGACAWRLRARQPSWRAVAAARRGTLVVSAGLAGLFLLPLLLDVLLRGRRSNVATILGRFYANTGDSKTPLQSLLYFCSFATSARNQEDIFTTPGPQIGEFFAAHLPAVAAWAAVFFLPPLLAWLLRRRLPAEERRFFLFGYLFLAATVGLCVVWGMAQAGPMVQFNGHFYYSVYYFALLLALGLAARGLGRVTPPAAVVAVCAVAAVVFTWSLRPVRLTDDEITGRAIRQGVATALREDPDGAPKLLVFEHFHWPQVAAVALELQRRGLKFYLAPWWSFMFGRQHELTRLARPPEDHAQVWWITTPAQGGIPIAPDLSIFTQPAPLRPEGGTIDFHKAANGFRYLVTGLQAGHDDYAPTDLPRLALVFTPLHAEHDLRIVFDAQSGTDGPQPADVFLNGHPLGRVVAAGQRAQLTVTAPAALWNEWSRGTLELRFPAADHARFYKRPDYEQWSAWSLWKISFERAPAAAK